MTEKQEPVSRTDVAEAIKGLASFPWDEMLATQRAMLKALNYNETERDSLVEAFQASETIAEKYAGAVAAESTAKIVKALEEVKKLQGEMKELQEKTEKAGSSYVMSLKRHEHFLESIMSGVHDVKRGLGFWGLVLAVLLFPGAVADFLYLLSRFGRMFG